jgi:hypothetical protein
MPNILEKVCWVHKLMMTGIMMFCGMVSKVFRAGLSVYEELSLADSVLDPIKRMSMALERFRV